MSRKYIHSPEWESNPQPLCLQLVEVALRHDCPKSSTNSNYFVRRPYNCVYKSVTI